MKDPRICIVIVGFEDEPSLQACLASIRAQTYANHRTLLVDNSVSRALERTFSRDAELEYVRSGSNLGFSRGVNLGIVRSIASDAEYTLLLNPDTVLEPDCLEQLVDAAASLPDVGIVGGRIHYLSDPGKTWYAGGKIDRVTGVGKHLVLQGETPVETSYVTGCCMLVPNALLRRIGGLKESIFMYLDDAEFCMRVRRAGFRLYYNPQARLGHRVGPGSDWRGYSDHYLYFSVRNRPLVASTVAYRAWLHAMAISIGTVKAFRYAVVPGIRDRGRKLRAIGWGILDSLTNEARERKRFPGLFSPSSATPSA